MHGREGFLAIRHHGVRARAGAINVAFLPDEGSSSAAVGYAVSRRVGNAVARNRLRRRLRAAVTDLARSDENVICGGSYVISPSPGAARLPFAELRTTLAAAMTKSRRLALAGSPR